MEIISLLLSDMNNIALFLPTNAAQNYLVNNYASFQVYWYFYHLQLVMIQNHCQYYFYNWYIFKLFLTVLNATSHWCPLLCICSFHQFFAHFYFLLSISFIFPFIIDAFNFPLSRYCLFNDCCLLSQLWDILGTKMFLNLPRILLTLSSEVELALNFCSLMR